MYIGKLDKEIYRCITGDMVTDEVIITDRQLQHIKELHPDSCLRTIAYLETVLKSPDYIIEDKHADTGLVIKKVDTENGFIQVVLRLWTASNDGLHKNSIISCWRISHARLMNYLRNKRILYKKM